MKIGRSRGVSTVIGAVFFVIITFLITTNIFLWSISQHNQYNLAVIQSNQIYADQINERIIVDNGNYSVATPYVKVNATLINGGPIASQIITLWVVDNTLKKYGYTSFSSSPINLAPGNETRINKSVTITGCMPSDSYDVWVVTARGNRIPIEQEQQYVTIVNILQMMGPVQVDFGSIRWRTENYKDNRPPYNGTYQIPKEKKEVKWSVTVTNYGFQEIHLNLTSAFRLDTLQEDKKDRTYYIDHEYTLPAGGTVTLEFWRKAATGGDWDRFEDPINNPGACPLTVALIGYYDNNPTALFGAAIGGSAILVLTTK